MGSFRLLLTESAAANLLRQPKRRQRVLMHEFTLLAEHPVTTGTMSFVDPEGRTNHVRVAAGHLISFWVDHAAREVHILDFEPQ